MPTTLLPPSTTDCPEPAPNRIRWTRQQCCAMQEAGILTGRYELVDGEILSKMGQNRPHALAVTLLVLWLAKVFGLEYVQSQLPIEIANEEGDYNEPEPDGFALANPALSYTQDGPGAQDLLLVVEVSDSSLRFDLTTKARLYARAGIRDYWAIDLNGRRILVHRDPTPHGYQQVTAYTAEETVSPLASPDAWVLVSELLPAR